MTLAGMEQTVTHDTSDLPIAEHIHPSLNSSFLVMIAPVLASIHEVQVECLQVICLGYLNKHLPRVTAYLAFHVALLIAFLGCSETVVVPETQEFLYRFTIAVFEDSPDYS